MRYAGPTSLPASTGGVCAHEPDAASFTLPSNLGASQRCDAVFMGAFCMFAFVVNHPWIAGLLLLAVLVSFLLVSLATGIGASPTWSDWVSALRPARRAADRFVIRHWR